MQNIHINKLEIPHFIIKHASPYAHRWFTYDADDVSHLKKITNTINLLLAVNVSPLKMCWLIQLEAILNYKKNLNFYFTFSFRESVSYGLGTKSVCTLARPQNCPV